MNSKQCRSLLDGKNGPGGSWTHDLSVNLLTWLLLSII